MTHPAPEPTIERALTAERLAQYVTRSRCARFLRLALFPSEARALVDRFKVSPEPLSPLLSLSGQAFERERVADLAAQAHVVDLTNQEAGALAAGVLAESHPATYFYQPKLAGQIGPWRCEGRADLVRVERTGDGAAAVTVIDVKASRRESIGFRLQVAFYAKLVRQALADVGVPIASIGGAIAGRESDLAAGAFDAFDLDLYEDDVDRLVAAPHSDVARAARTPLVEAGYALGPHCDGCPYSAACFVETAEREDLSLVPTITAPEKAALRAEGVTTARELAALLDYGTAGVTPAPGRTELLARLERRRLLATRLPMLVQRAKAAMRRLDPEVEAKPFLYGSGFGSLPSEEAYPDLVRIFVDAQRDYLEDRLYLLACVVTGPAGDEEIVEITAAPPDDAAERELLLGWLRRVLPAVARAAGKERAPLHVYLFDRRGQRVLLDALTRHFDAVCAIPAFYDLLTASPALSQAMVSFLAEEVRERRNLGPICQNLYQVASELGFRWEEDAVAARETFRTRIFDNRHPFERDPETKRFRRPDRIGSETLWVESVARFGTLIPLEYAYAAWGLLDSDGDERAQLDRYAGVGLAELAALARLRCRALRHIEARFAQKNRAVLKAPLDLAGLDRIAAEPHAIPFSRSLEDFLFLEHHASRQGALLHLALSPEQRAQTGRSAILRCEAVGENGTLASFLFSDRLGRPAPVEDVSALKFRDGSWLVLNPIESEAGTPLSAGQLVRGRLAVAERVDERSVRLRLMPLSFSDSAFRYKHRLHRPDEGAVYTVDEMVDDLNADKFLEAVRNAESNVLYRWIERPEEGRRSRELRPSRLRLAAELAELFASVQRPNGLTDAQRDVIGGRAAERVVVVQGPPGTGKSHTLGLAVIARALALRSAGRPFRVAVLAKTHAASLVALESVARRARELQSALGDDERIAPLGRLRLAKVCNDPVEAVPDGVERLLTLGADRGAVEQFCHLLNEPLLVVGGTPGGLYNLVRHGAAGSDGIDWRQKYFDLVVVDEASQMGIAEALTAAAFLREDGQFLAIGDHRQMPPILAHAWDRERRRHLEAAKPFQAIFDFLREARYPSAALDQSFRIPAEIAAFLERHVYSQDGVRFRSENRTRLERVAGLDGWLEAVFEPGYPLVVVEHDETGSQQANEFEAALVGEIVGAARRGLGLDARHGVGIVVPHGAQRTLLRTRFGEIAEAVDTVERFQGGERDLIVVSATVSDPGFAELESAFLLEPRRLTVAISRPKRKLVLVASRTIFDLIPAELEEYERGALWKWLHRECAPLPLWEGEIAGHRVRVRALAAETGAP